MVMQRIQSVERNTFAAFKKGQDDRAAGISDNPFDPHYDTARHRSWVAGWRDRDRSIGREASGATAERNIDSIKTFERLKDEALQQAAAARFKRTLKTLFVVVIVGLALLALAVASW